MRRIVHVLPRLEAGGAERVLIDVSARLAPAWDQVVVSLTDRGALAETIEASGIAVHAIGFQPSVPNPVAFGRLVRVLRRLRPDLVETWLYKADLLGGLATVFAGRPPLLWSVHQTDLPPIGRLRSNVRTARVCARLSGRMPTLVLCASEEAAAAHAAMGYRADKLRVVPNGVDTDRFRPDPDGRTRVRTELGVPEPAPLVGLVARFDPQKDHPTFAAAARMILDRVPEVRFVLCGRKITWDNPELLRLLDDAGVRDRVTLLGVRHDMPELTAALDLAVSASAFGEAFSVAISEALAAGVACVATDTGNARSLIGDTGRVVPPRDPAALAAAVVEVLRMPGGKRRAMAAKGRALMVSRFSIAAVARGYEATYDEVLRLARVNSPE
jgi:glycosyltransferase involved in cell wall biosynthesis